MLIPLCDLGFSRHDLLCSRDLRVTERRVLYFNQPCCPGPSRTCYIEFVMFIRKNTVKFYGLLKIPIDRFDFVKKWFRLLLGEKRR